MRRRHRCAAALWALLLACHLSPAGTWYCGYCTCVLLPRGSFRPATCHVAACSAWFSDPHTPFWPVLAAFSSWWGVPSLELRGSDAATPMYGPYPLPPSCRLPALPSSWLLVAFPLLVQVGKCRPAHNALPACTACTAEGGKGAKTSHAPAFTHHHCMLASPPTHCLPRGCVWACWGTCLISPITIQAELYILHSLNLKP